MDYMTLEHMAEYFSLLSIINVDGLDGAVWRNYSGMSLERKKLKRDIVYIKKCDSAMHNVFGTPYLTEGDWVIELK